MSDDSFERGLYPLDQDPADRCIALLRDLAFEISAASWEMKQQIVEFEENTFQKVEFARRQIEQQQKKVACPSFTPNKAKKCARNKPAKKNNKPNKSKKKPSQNLNSQPEAEKTETDKQPHDASTTVDKEFE